MDFILKKMNSLITVCDEKTVEKQTLLRERIEYVLFSMLGYLWNENLDEIDVTKRAELIENLDRMSIGEVVGAIRLLDANKELLTKSNLKILDKYPQIRNEALGHGYTHNDTEGILEKQLEDLYNELNTDIRYINNAYDLIRINKIDENRYVGIRFSYENGGLPQKWSCPIELIDDENAISSVFVLIGEKYYKISPFIAIESNGEEIYVFQSLLEKLTGNIKMSKLFNSGHKEFIFKELITISDDSERRRISANRTIMNYFETNYRNYIPVEIEKSVIDFLSQNRSNVLCTVWGHGGVGKTACIQSICMKLFNALHKEFSYIIFLSAKDRMLDPRSGKIIEITNLRTYDEMISGIIAVLYNEDIDIKNVDLEVNEKRIYENSGSILLVIDDYETFPDTEKIKIQNFINHLNIDHHRVIITTRNKRLSSGINIPTNELDYENTKKFLLSIFKNEYPEQLDYIRKITEDKSVMTKIHEATSGRAIFLYQFANLYVQRGYKDNLLTNLKDSENAQEFLYGRIYSYLSDGAKKAFVCISQITDDKDYIFKGRILEYLLQEEDNDDVTTQPIEELLDQKVIEQYDEENYRVYSKELFRIMKNTYEEMSGSYKDTIKTKLADIGGKDIKGTIYEAMLNEANLSRTKGNAKETVEKYRRLLNDKKCDKKVKKKALINLTSYINIDLMNIDGAISVLEDYFKSCSFESDIDINKIYVQLLWASDNDAKQKACDILERYFKEKEHKKTAYRNLELFSLAVRYCINNALVNKKDKDTPGNLRNRQRLFNEYGKELFEYVSKKQLSEFKPAVKHNFSIALVQTAYLCLDLLSDNDDKLSYAKDIVSYGEKNFNEIFRPSLKKIRYSIKEEEQKKFINHKIGNIVQATIVCIKPYGAIAVVDGTIKALLHISEIADRRIINIYDELHPSDEITAKIIDISDKGYRISMKGMR